jgi:hypothetical protein
MTKDELLVRLRSAGVSSESYSVGGPLPPYEGLVLGGGAGGWRIEHFERGMRQELGFFESEEQAFDRMYELLIENFR